MLAAAISNLHWEGRQKAAKTPSKPQQIRGGVKSALSSHIRANGTPLGGGGGSQQNAPVSPAESLRAFEAESLHSITYTAQAEGAWGAFRDSRMPVDSLRAPGR